MQLILVALVWLMAPQDEPAVNEQIEVSLKKVIVRVTDLDGKPIEGLQSSDFELKTGSRSIPLVHFEEKKLATFGGDSSAPDAPEPDESQVLAGENQVVRAQRNMVVIFDTSTMSPEGYEKVKPEIDAYLLQLPQSFSIKLVHLESGYMRQLTPFTTDRDKLATALVGMEYHGKVYRDLTRDQNTINHMLNQAAKRRGSPFATMKTYVESKRRIKKNHLLTFTKGLDALGKILDPLPGERSIWVISGGGYLERETSFLLAREAEELNARNIPLHTLLATDKYAIGTRTVTAGWNDEHSLDVKHGSIYRPNDYRETTQTREVMHQEAAETTGGAFIRNNDIRNLHKHLDMINESMAHYYVLWYRTDKNRRALDVKLARKRRGVKLHYGKQVGFRTPYHELEDKERQLEFFATLQYGSDSGDHFLTASWDFHEFAHSKDGWHYSVGTQLNTLHRAEGPYEIGIALLDEDRQPLAVRHKILGKLPAHESVTIYDMIAGKQRPSFISCTVRDMTNSALNQRVFRLPALDKKEGPHLSSLVFLELGVHRPMVSLRQLEGDQTQPNPYAVNQGQVPPSFSRKFVAPKSLGVFFRLLERQVAHEDYDIGVALVQGEQRIDVPMEINLSEDNGAGESYFLCSIEAASLEPGDYTVLVRAAQRQGGASIVRRNFRVVR